MKLTSSGRPARDEVLRGCAEVWHRAERGWRCNNVWVDVSLGQARKLPSDGCVVRWEARGPPLLLAASDELLKSWRLNRRRELQGERRPWSGEERARLHELIRLHGARTPPGAVTKLARDLGRAPGAVRRMLHRARRGLS